MYSKWPPFHCHSQGCFYLEAFFCSRNKNGNISESIPLTRSVAILRCPFWRCSRAKGHQGKRAALSFKILLAYQTIAFDTEHRRCHEYNIPIILIE